jgi:hypothetical protein
VTAHAIEMLGALGMGDTPAARSGVRWLIAQQEADGSWFGRWGINHVYGTGAALPGLIAAGVAPSHPCIRRAVDWLERHQNEDGGWGEDARSYDDPDAARAPRRRRPGRCSHCMLPESARRRSRAVSHGSCPRSARTAAGMSPNTPGPASHPTTTSTTTSTD